jgi:ubiquinone biosynthesis monooxygenase Coq7
MNPMNRPERFRSQNTMDALLGALGDGLAAVWGAPVGGRPTPQPEVAAADLSSSERRVAGALMRVNHVGEVCAQALYTAQAVTSRDPERRAFYGSAAVEEADHLAWTRERLNALGAAPSLLNPFWFAGAFALGGLAGMLGDRVSLGFMIETERQVERHLAGHLRRLPESDRASRAVLEQMRRDEAEHAQAAAALGGVSMPGLVRRGMAAAARVMTTLAYWV